MAEMSYEDYQDDLAEAWLENRDLEMLEAAERADYPEPPEADDRG